MPVSIRFVNVSLVASCTVLVGALTAVLALTRADVALDDTRKARDFSLSIAFASGEAAALDLANSMLDSSSAATLRDLSSYWVEVIKLTDTECKLAQYEPPHVSGSWEYAFSRLKYFAAAVQAYEELYSFAILATSNATVLLVDHAITSPRSPDEYHHLQVWMRQLHPDRGVYGEMNSTGQLHMFDAYDTEVGCEHNASARALANGTLLVSPCRTLVNQGGSRLYKHLDLPLNRVAVSDMRPGHMTQITHVVCRYGNSATGEEYGHVVSTASTHLIQKFLRKVHLTEYGRVFLVVRSHFFELKPSKESDPFILAGTSHGSSYGISDKFVRLGYTDIRVPLPAANCSDHLVANASVMLRELGEDGMHSTNGYELLLASGRAEMRTLNTSRFPFGEAFFVSVKTFRVPQGPEWYVVSLVDKEEILGNFERSRAAAIATISKNQDAVDSDMTSARVVVCVVLIVVTLSAIALSCFLVFRVTEPLLQLMRSMSQVAVMKFEYLDSPQRPSTITEVRNMMDSFEAMVANLREYKTFIPAALFETSPHLGPSVVDYTKVPGLETRVAAVVFTDIQGSTRLWELCPHGMHAALSVHNSIMREEILNKDGYEVKTIGDSFMATFSNIRNAVCFGLSVQERLRDATWPDSLLQLRCCAVSPMEDSAGICVRVGVNYGDVTVEWNELVGRYDYFGSTVNRAARLEAACLGGTVAVPAAALPHLASLQDEMVSICMGPRKLKGIDEAIELYALVPARLRMRVLRIREQLGNPLMAKRNNASSEVSVSSRVSTTSSDAPQLSPHFSDGLVAIDKATVALTSADDGGLTFSLPIDLSQSLTGISAAAERTNGTMLSVTGSTVAVGWNVMQKCGDHTDSGFRFVGLLTRRVHEMQCGISTGSVHAGYVRVSGQRYLTACGTVMQRCFDLFALTKTYSVSTLYATDDNAAVDVLCDGRFLRPVGELVDTPTIVYQVHCDRVQEWSENKHVPLLAPLRGSRVQEEGDKYDAWGPLYRLAYDTRDLQMLQRLSEGDPAVSCVSEGFRNRVQVVGGGPP